MNGTENVKVISTGINASEWIIFNVQQTGYYRVNYEIENWQALTDQLLTEHPLIHITNRAQMLDDALNLARAG